MITITKMVTIMKMMIKMTTMKIVNSNYDDNNDNMMMTVMAKIDCDNHADSAN